MDVLVGMSIGACAMLFVQLVVHAATPRLPQMPSDWPQRLDTLAAWGRLRVYTVKTKTALPPLPRRSPGAAFYHNPDLPVFHVPITRYALQDRIAFEWVWAKTLWRRIVRWVESEIDPFARWDFTGWWRDTFYVQPNGRHQFTPPPVADAILHDTQWLTTVCKIDYTDSRNRRIRTEAQWAKIIETNLRTKAIRDAHRARRSGLVREDDAVERDLATVRG